MLKNKYFELGFGTIEFKNDFQKYNELQCEYELYARESADNFTSKFIDRFENMHGFVEHCENEFQVNLSKYLDKVVEKLITEEIYDVEIDYLVTNYYRDDRYVFDEYLDPIINEYFSIVDNQDAQSNYRTQRRQSRSKLIGGGFGLAGAAQGIATAGAVNIVSGVMHGTFNILGSAVTSVKNKNKLDELFKPKELKNALYNAVYYSIKNLHLSFIEAYETSKCSSYGRLPSSDEIEQSLRLVKNLSNGKIPENKVNETITNALNLNPYDRQLYTYALSNTQCNNESLFELCDFLSIESRGVESEYNKNKTISSFSKVDDFRLVSSLDYNSVHEYIKKIMILNRGTIIKKKSSDSKIYCGYKVGLNSNAIILSANFTQVDNLVEILFEGELKDGFDALGYGKRKAVETINLVLGTTEINEDEIISNDGDENGKKIDNKSKNITASLSLIFGMFGAHKFYIGNWGIGLIYFASLFIMPGLSLLISVIESIRLFIMTKPIFDEKYNSTKIKPFTIK